MKYSETVCLAPPFFNPHIAPMGATITWTVQKAHYWKGTAQLTDTDQSTDAITNAGEFGSIIVTPTAKAGADKFTEVGLLNSVSADAELPEMGGTAKNATLNANPMQCGVFLRPAFGAEVKAGAKGGSGSDRTVDITIEMKDRHGLE